VLHKQCKFGRSRSVKKGTILFEAETFFSPNCARHFSGVTETAGHAFRGRALEAEEVWSNSISNEGLFTLETKRIFSAYLVSDLNVVVETEDHAHNLPMLHMEFILVGICQ
jgi:hypothetical protein